MVTIPSRGLLRRIAYIWLGLRVHFDAFKMFPGRYLTATKWWLLRKRVRARGQFAPILSGSPRAYEYWALRNERHVSCPRTDADIKLFALIGAGGNLTKLSATLQSLATSGVEPIVVGEPANIAIRSLAARHEFAKAQWLIPMEAGDLIASQAGAAYRMAIQQAEPSCTVLYADDDKLDQFGHRKDPYFKPDWNPELQQHHDILTGACAICADSAALEEAAEQSDWAFFLVAKAAQQGSVAHIPAVLHHRAARKPAPAEVARLSISDYLSPASVIIPIRNRVDLLRTCISGLRSTDYPELEIIVANNDSDDAATLAYLRTLAGEGVTILDQPGPFNYSTINNKAVNAARGELLCLMNNDIEVLRSDWLAMMATQAQRRDVGAVGAQLLYPDGRIQHAGVVIGVGNAAGHAHRFLQPEAEGYFRRHALPQFVSAVTGACLVVRKDRFIAVGGLDESNFAVAFNDVDLCLKLNARGWQSFYEPRALLVHHESVSRGHDADPVGAARFATELAALQRIWRTNEIVDPYHHPMLSRASEQFALDLTATMMPR